jgi:hypothetical protein
MMMLAMWIRCVKAGVNSAKFLWPQKDFERAGSAQNQMPLKGTFMKMRRMEYGAAVLAFALTVSGCGKEEAETASPPLPEQSALQKMKQEVKETADATKEYFIKQKDELQKNLSGRMAEFDKELTGLKARSQTASEDAGTEWTNALTRLERQKAVATEKLNQFADVSERTWQEVKAGAESAVNEFEKVLKETVARFKSEEKPAQ